MLISGEARIGKSSLVKAFCDNHRKGSNIFKGNCDALFTPRPLAPLYDVLWEWRNGDLLALAAAGHRNELFIRFLSELKKLAWPTILIFEDIHWADWKIRSH